MCPVPRSVPVLVFPDAEPFHQILGALKFGMKTVLLPFEPGDVLHRHAEERQGGKVLLYTCKEITTYMCRHYIYFDLIPRKHGCRPKSHNHRAKTIIKVESAATDLNDDG